MPRKPGTSQNVTVHIPIAEYHKLVAEANRCKSFPSTIATIGIIYYLEHRAGLRAQKRRDAAARRTARETADA